ncbi:MAG TPA: SIMPL domain-containing protein [Pyrinomonadaceae bacterium]|nr:SIMPL domain-containing protein [Pyrinomonadaceae bacterium]
MMTNRLLRATIFFILVTCVSSAVAQQQAEPPLITVTGQAEVKVPPDEVVFTLAVVKVNKDLLVAKEENDRNVRSIMELARRYNIAQQDVQTDYIGVTPKYRDVRRRGALVGEEEAERVFEGYEVSKTVVIRLRDVKRFESLLSEILRAGIDRVRDIDFRTSEIRKYKDDARAMAIRAAREKALALTKEIGQTIGKAHTIREEGYSYGSSNAMANNTTMISGDFSAEETSTIAPGMITVSARVTVSFLLN